MGAEIRKQLLVGREYSFEQKVSVAPLDETLASLAADRALMLPNGAERSIWEIVMHLATWLENVVVRIETGEAADPVQGAWPALRQFATTLPEN